MNRFDKNSRSAWNVIKKVVMILFLCAVVFFFLFGLNSVSASTLERQEESLQNAINRDIIQCYALEGTYPPNLEYLESHYGLTYDHDLFFVDYQAIGSNIMPDVTIVRLTDASNLIK